MQAKIDETRLPTLTKHRRVADARQSSLQNARSVAAPGFRILPPKPIALVEQDGQWKITRRRIAMYMLDEFNSGDIGMRAIPWCLS